MQRQTSLHTSLPVTLRYSMPTMRTHGEAGGQSCGGALVFPKQRVDNGVFCEDGVIYEVVDGSVTPIMETKDILLPCMFTILKLYGGLCRRAGDGQL